MEPDLEKADIAAENPLGGYDRLAKLMGEAPDLAIFRRFAHLSAQSLLHYQAELMVEEERLREFQARDRQAGEGTDRSVYAFNSRRLREAGMYSDSDDSETDATDQWNTIQTIRGLLKEYYPALVLHQKIVNLNKPHAGQLESLNDWMSRPTMGRMNLDGIDGDVWAKSELDELISLQPSTPDGVEVSSRLTAALVKLYHKVIGRHIHKVGKGDHLRNSILYHDKGVLRFVRGLKAIVACMLPVVGIIALYYIEDMITRLGVIAAFAAIFSLTMCLFTSATVKDIFGATAAFSAVLVVFVGTRVD